MRPATVPLVLLAMVAGRAGAATPPSPSGVTIYPATAGVKPSDDYRVRIAGREAFVYKTPVCSFAAFGTGGGAEIVVDVARPIRRAVIRPLAKHVAPVVGGTRVTFAVSGPCQLVLEVDEDLRRPLFLFANPPETDAPAPGASNVRYFEGGRIHDAGTIRLQSGQTIYLAAGAIVRGVIRAERATDARVMGPGILDASTREQQSKTILFDRCARVEVNGPIVLGSYGWSIVPSRCENVRVTNVKVVGWRDNDDGCDPDSSRQVLIDRSFFRTKDDCIAVKAHEASGSENAADAGNAEDVRVSGCTFWSAEWGHAMTIGFAVRAPRISNVVFADNDVVKKEKGPALSIDNHDLGTVEHVRFEDIRVEDGCDRLIALKVAFSEYSADCPVEFYRNNPHRREPKGEEWLKIVEAKRYGHRGMIRDVAFKNIQVPGSRVPPSDIRGWSDRQEITDVAFENIRAGDRVLKSADEMKVRVGNAANVTFAGP